MLSYKCPNCHYCEQVPNNGLAICKMKQISLLEPIHIIYSGLECSSYLYDSSKPTFLDSNHRITNIPAHKMEIISSFEYHPGQKKTWMHELQKKCLLQMQRFIERFEQNYGQSFSLPLKHRKCEIETEMKHYLVYNRYRTMNLQTIKFWIGFANTLITKLEVHAWRLLTSE